MNHTASLNLRTSAGNYLELTVSGKDVGVVPGSSGDGTSPVASLLEVCRKMASLVMEKSLERLSSIFLWSFPERKLSLPLSSLFFFALKTFFFTDPPFPSPNVPFYFFLFSSNFPSSLLII